MTAFAHIRGGDTVLNWATGTTVTPLEFSNIGTSIYKSLNARDGGTWAPSAPIIIGGSGAQFTTVATQFYGVTISGGGDLSCTGNADLQADVTLGGTVGNTITVVGLFQANYYAQFHGPTSFDSGTDPSSTVTSDVAVAWTFNGTTTLAGFCHCTANVTFDGGSSGAHGLFVTGEYMDVWLRGPVTVDDAAQFNGDVTLGNASGDALVVNATETHNAGETHNGTVVHNGTVGHHGPVSHDYATVTGSGATIPAGARHVILNISGGGDVLLPAAVDGQMITLVNDGSSTTVFIKQGASLIYAIINSGGVSPWVDMLCVGSFWQIFRRST